MKIKTLKVKPTYVPQRGLRKLGAGEERVYLVLQVTDSLTPLVNDTLTTKECQVYCDNRHWKVTVQGSGLRDAALKSRSNTT